MNKILKMEYTFLKYKKVYRLTKIKSYVNTVVHISMQHKLCYQT